MLNPFLWCVYPFWKKRWPIEIMFWSLLVVFCAPIFRYGHFPTLDGPALFYNAHIWKQLLTDGDTLSNFFTLNTFPVPYLLLHLLWSVFAVVFTPAWIEPIIFTLYACGLALGFKHLARQLAGAPSPLEWLGLLLIFNMPMRMGFINYCFGLVVLLLCLRVFLKRGMSMNRGHVAQLATLLLMAYFTHLFTYGSTVLMLMACATWLWFGSTPSFRKRVLIKHWALAVAPSMLLAIGSLIYLYTQGDGGGTVGPRTNALQALSEFGPLITLTYEPQVIWTRWMFWTTLIMTVVMIGLRWGKGNMAQNGDLFGVMSLLLFIFAALGPDQVVGMSWMTSRLLLIIILFWFLWLATCPVAKWLQWTYLLVMMIGGVPLLNVQDDLTKSLAHEADEFWDVANAIPTGSVILPVNCSDNWMHANFSTYLGMGEDQVVLDDIHALAPHGPALWKDHAFLRAYGDNATSTRPCLDLRKGKEYLSPPASLISLWQLPIQGTDSCADDLRQQLVHADVLVRSSGGYLVVMKLEK